MLKVIKKLFGTPRLTQGYPRKPMDTRRFAGRTVIDAERCTRCGECAARCPSQAIVLDGGDRKAGINYDECIFCGLCEEVCPAGAVVTTTEFELASGARNTLRASPSVVHPGDIPPISCEALQEQIRKKAARRFRRSLRIREVDAGSCNGCDYETNALNNPFNDLERLGIQFVASPRHADLLLVTGAGTRNMQEALIKTYNAAPDPKWVVAVGACACSGGIFRGSYATADGIDRLVPVDVYVPGCPPRPQAILYGILLAIGRKPHSR